MRKIVYTVKNSYNFQINNYMNRNNCVICNNNIFSINFDLFNTINIVENNENLYNSCEVKKLNFIGCDYCGCIQLKNLFPQHEIYSEPLQVFDGPAIRKHHDLFCDFIINNIHYEPILFEIGGSYGNLAKRIISKYNENSFDIIYKIMEFSADYYPTINNIEYISGNCEEYDYKGINTIIMSHVFEHLYKPRDFIENISKTDVKNIFISIPDMDNLMKINDINNINILHTFYINTKFITYLFQLYGFTLKNKYEYTNNSIFYYFYKSSQTIEIEYKQISLLNEIPTFYETIISKIKSINIINSFYICPSGFYGQFIYFNLNEYSNLHLY
jgi:hypothetical protein